MSTLYELARRVFPESVSHILREMVHCTRRSRLDSAEIKKASMEVELCRKLGLRYRLENFSDGLVHAVPEIMTNAEIQAALCQALGTDEQELSSTLTEFGTLWKERVMPKLAEVSHVEGRPLPPHPGSYATVAQQEAFALYATIKHKDVRSILDIGGMIGFSAWFFAECLQRLGRQGKVHAIDVNRDGLSMLPDTESFTIDYAVTSLPERGYGAVLKHSLVKNFGFSEEILPQLLPAVSFDLVYHDCAHSWRNTYFNVSECMKWCKDATIQACHDWRAPYRKDADRCAERQVFNHFFREGYHYFGVVELHGVGFAFRDIR